MHNADDSGDIEFREFILAMSSLSPRATLEEKLKLVFACFDMNQTVLMLDTAVGAGAVQLLNQVLANAVWGRVADGAEGGPSWTLVQHS